MRKKAKYQGTQYIYSEPTTENKPSAKTTTVHQKNKYGTTTKQTKG